MEDLDLGVDIKVFELVGFLLFTEGVALGCFGDILTTCVFAEEFWSESCQSATWVVTSGLTYVRPRCDETYLRS